MSWILVTGCGHPTSVASTISSDGESISPSTELCDSCNDHQALKDALESARLIHARLNNPDRLPPRSEQEAHGLKRLRRRAKKVVRAATMHLANDVVARQALEASEGFVTRTPSGERAIPEAGEAITKASHDRRVRIMELEHHRNEDQYRHRSVFHRGLWTYVPGTWADTTTWGFFNTNDPDVDNHLPEAQDFVDSRSRREKRQARRKANSKKAGPTQSEKKVELCLV